jgi:hypothetical protein
MLGQAMIDLDHAAGLAFAGHVAKRDLSPGRALERKRREIRHAPLAMAGAGKSRGIAEARLSGSLLFCEKPLGEGQQVMECRHVSDLTLTQAIDNIYASIKNDNEELDSHIAALKAPWRARA